MSGKPVKFILSVRPMVLLIIMNCLFVGGCGSGKYELAVKNGKVSIPYANDMNRLFPGGNNFISHYGFKTGLQVWNTEVFLYDRYVLTMQVDVVLDASGVKIASLGDPQFFLEEVVNIDVPDPDHFHTLYGDAIQFGKADWDKVLKSKGDITVLGMPIKTKSPVLHFELEKMSNAG